MISDASETIRYVPIHPEVAERASRMPFDLSRLSVTGLVIICDLDDPPPGNTVPTMSMKMTQYLRLSDDSLLRLDMDRGVTTFRYGDYGPISWKRSSEDVIAEVLTLIKGDEPDPESFPWEEYAQAAVVRGISVTAEQLTPLPYQVMLSDALAAVYEF